jgi:16S rRNA processing protein RimM
LSDVLWVGRVGRPHGLDGSFHVNEATANLPAGGGVVQVAGKPCKIARRAGTEQKPILRLEGASKRADAEALIGAELTVPRDDSLLEEGEYWAHQLEGLAVTDGERAIGYVRRMLALPSCEVLEVDRADGSELLVPMVRDAIRSIDVEARRIDVNLEFIGE